MRRRQREAMERRQGQAADAQRAKLERWAGRSPTPTVAPVRSLDLL